MNERGVSFLEIIVVVAILMIVGAFASPSITDWRGKRALKSDYTALLSNINFLKTRVRIINGTRLLICNSPTIDLPNFFVSSILYLSSNG